MKNTRGILFLPLVMLPLLGHAQKVVYGYDVAGNRISRYIVLNTRRSASPDAAPLFKAAPNPVEDILQVSYEDEADFSGEYRYTLQSVYGNTALSGTSQTADCRIDVSSLSKGVYILHITYMGEEQSIKIIKK